MAMDAMPAAAAAVAVAAAVAPPPPAAAVAAVAAVAAAVAAVAVVVAAVAAVALAVKPKAIVKAWACVGLYSSAGRTPQGDWHRCAGYRCHGPCPPEVAWEAAHHDAHQQAPPRTPVASLLA
jgi:hypothetical protein